MSNVEALKKAPWFKGRKGPVLLVIMDGVGFGKFADGDAVAAATKPNLDWLMANCPTTKLKAHGVAVGLPSDADMGNSEVGHNAMGAGRVFDQGAKLVSNSIANGTMFEDTGWTEIASNVLQNHSTLHFIGLFSDGNVHSHIDHLKAMMDPRRTGGSCPRGTPIRPRIPAKTSPSTRRTRSSSRPSARRMFVGEVLFGQD